MSTRKRFRELIACGRLVPMPGAYDALSAKIMDAEGFEAIIAGGYAAIGSMMVLSSLRGAIVSRVMYLAR